MTQQPSAPHDIPSTTLHLADRTIVVEATPLAKSRQTRLGTIVDQPRPSRLQVKQLLPRWARWLLAILLMVVTAPIATALAFVLYLLLERGRPRDPTSVFMVMFITVVVLVSFALVPVIFIVGVYAPVEFVGQHVRKRRLGRYPPWLRQARILVVQLIPGRADEDLRGSGPSLQLNLILDNPEHPRVGFITYRDAEWTRQAGRRLADYLGVPLVDQILAWH
jgi:hypothetical protein